jgi:hypothetical protein
MAANAPDPPPPKRGFNNIFAKPWNHQSHRAHKFEDGSTVNVCDLLEKGILSVRVRVQGAGQRQYSKM